MRLISCSGIGQKDAEATIRRYEIDRELNESVNESNFRHRLTPTPFLNEMTAKASNMIFLHLSVTIVPVQESEIRVAQLAQYVHGDASPAAAGQLAGSAGAWAVP